MIQSFGPDFSAFERLFGKRKKSTINALLFGTFALPEVVMSPVKDDAENIVGVSTIARDISDRDRAARALQAKQNLQRLIEAQEDERKRIARDLHDELGQQLIALRLKLESTKSLCRDEEICEKISEMQIIAENIDKGVDSLTWDLRPAALKFGADQSITKPFSIDELIEMVKEQIGDNPPPKY